MIGEGELYLRASPVTVKAAAVGQKEMSPVRFALFYSLFAPLIALEVVPSVFVPHVNNLRYEHPENIR